MEPFLNNCRFKDHQFKQLYVSTRYLDVSQLNQGLDKKSKLSPFSCSGTIQELPVLKPATTWKPLELHITVDSHTTSLSKVTELISKDACP